VIDFTRILGLPLSKVCERLQEAFGEAVYYTHVDGKGTLVQASSTIDSVQFQAVTCEAIAASQNQSLSTEQS
jgi:hypothetical protein